MKNGYKIRWSTHAITELERTYAYLENNWTEKELKNLSGELERVLMMISRNPSMFPVSDMKNIRKAKIKRLKYNLLQNKRGGKDS